MGLSVNRMAHSVSFNAGISTAEYNETPQGQTLGLTQQSILPGSTTVSRALDEVFPINETVSAQILGVLASQANSVALRTTNGFRMAADKAISELKEKNFDQAAQEVVQLLEDGDLLERYRASLLES